VNAIDNVFQDLEEYVTDIKIVGLSTTLATNSLLQGKGGDVGLIGIGWKPDPEWNLGCKRSRFIKGGFDSIGRMLERIDENELKEAMEEITKDVDAVVVSGYFSVSNGWQEIEVRNALMKCTDLPVMMGQTFSTDLGIYERTTTAVLNAKLLTIINEFLDGIEKALDQRQIDANIFVFKGDGGLMPMDMARERPVEMILSGPAASLMGGKVLSGMDNCIVIDMGGTSTDIALMDDGFPRLNKEGAVVGDWRTRVKGIDIWTCGLGGDSNVVLDNRRNIKIGPERVIPLALAAMTYPGLSQKMIDEKELNLYLPNTDNVTSRLTEREARVLRFVMANAPCTLYDVMKGIDDIPVVEHELNALRSRGLIIRTGLTPTDALHHLGRYVIGDPECSRTGLEILSARHYMEARKIAEDIIDAVIMRIGEELIKKSIVDHGDQLPDAKGFSTLLRASAGAALLPGMMMKAIPDRPIVGIGAPAMEFIKPLEGKMSCQVIVPEGYEVGNAVGAISSLVSESVMVQVFLRDDKYFVFSPMSSPGQYSSLDCALSGARSIAENIVRDRIRSPFVEDVKVRIETFEKRFADGYSQESKFVNWVDIRATATARPKLKG
jgi:N-methylhydantoinase A/oxoprolinase/acetone carboxylase beta subunit